MQPWLFVARPGSTASAECEQAVDSYAKCHRDSEQNCQPTHSRCQLDFKDQSGIANLKPSSLFYVGHKHLQFRHTTRIHTVKRVSETAQG